VSCTISSSLAPSANFQFAFFNSQFAMSFLPSAQALGDLGYKKANASPAGLKSFAKFWGDTDKEGTSWLQRSPRLERLARSGDQVWLLSNDGSRYSS
jgi:hypothetical protein